MSKKSLLALLLAVCLPAICYFIVSGYSKNAVNMPPRFYVDTVINKVVNGKSTSDTLWHKVPNITLTNQLGEQVSFADLKDKILVVNFFFTRCPSICPTLTNNMKSLQDAFKIKDPRKRIDTPFVHFISITVDPTRDTPTVLKKYADKYGVNSDVWWMLTGPKDSIYHFALDEMKLATQDGGGVDSNFIHTERFVLIDKERVIRGYYNGLDSASMARLAEDFTILMLEKDKKKKRKLF